MLPAVPSLWTGLPKSGLMSKTRLSPARFYLECFSELSDFLFEPAVGFCYGYSDLASASRLFPERGGNTGKSCRRAAPAVCSSHLPWCAEASLPTVYRTWCHICAIRPDRMLARLALEFVEEQRRGRRWDAESRVSRALRRWASCPTARR